MNFVAYFSFFMATWCTVGLDLVSTQLRIEEGPHAVRHVSPVTRFSGYLYGTANKESYSFQMGTRMAPINQVLKIVSIIIFLWYMTCDVVQKTTQCVLEVGGFVQPSSVLKSQVAIFIMLRFQGTFLILTGSSNSANFYHSSCVFSNMKYFRNNLVSWSDIKL